MKKNNLPINRRISAAFNKLNASEIICLALSAFVLLSLSIYIFAGMPSRLTSDSANHAVLAEEMLYTGQYIPQDWNSRMDIYVIGPHVIMAFLTLFMDDQVLMLSITCLLHLAAVMAVFIYCSRVVSGNRCWMLFAPLLLCGISEDYMRIVYDQISYIVPMLFIFLVIAMFTDSLDNGRQIKTKLKYILCLLLLTVLTAQGARYIQAIALPLIAAIVLMFVSEHRDDTFMGALKSKDFRFTMLHAAAIAAVTVAGIVLFVMLGHAHNFLTSKDLSTFSSAPTDTLLNFYEQFLNLMGIERGCSMFSVDGIINLIKLVGGIMLLIILPVLQIRKFSTETYSMKFFTVFACMHVLEILILAIFCNALDATRYLYTSMFLLYYLSAHYITKYIFTDKATLKSIFAAICACVFVLPVSLPKALSVKGSAADLANARAITEYLEDKGLTYGYATTWNSVVNTVYSDCRVRINKASLSPVASIRRNNSDRAYFEETYQGRSFLLTKGSNERKEFLASDSYQLFGEPALTDRFGEYYIFVYDYNIANNDFGGIDGGFTPEESTSLFTIKNELSAVGIIKYSEQEGCQLISSDTAYGKASDSDAVMIISDTDVLPFGNLTTVDSTSAPEGYRIYLTDKSAVSMLNHANLLRNGDFSNGTEGWHIGKGITVKHSTDGIVVTCTGTTDRVFCSDVDIPSELIGKPVTLSIAVENYSGTASIYAEDAVSGTCLATRSIEYGDIIYSCTFIPVSECVTIYAAAPKNIGNYVMISEVKLEPGGVPTI